MSIGSPASAFIRNGQVFTAPSGVGTSGQVLTTNADGTTSWTTVSGGGGGLPSIPPFTILANSTNGTAQPTGVAAFTIGAQGTSNSVDAVITISRVITNASQGNQNSHAFSDSSWYKNNGFAYCSYDARMRISDIGLTVAHVAPFQSILSITGGTLTEYDGFYSEPDVATGATITNAYHFRVRPSQSNPVGGNDGLGTTQNHYSFYVPLPLGATNPVGFGPYSNWVIYSPDQTNISVHSGPFFFGYGTAASGGYSGAITATATSLEICQGCYYDPVLANYYPLAASSSYVIIEPHLPGSNSLAFVCGPTPSTLNTPIAIKKVPLEFGYNLFGGTTYWAFARLGDNGPLIYSSTSNMLQFNGIASTNPAMLFANNLITVIGADNSTACAVTVTGALTAASAILTAALTASNGGTGLQTLTAHAVMLGEGTSAVGFATIGTAGRVFVDKGAGADPAFVVMSGDATISSTGAITVTKSSGSAFGSAAFVSTSAFDAAGTAATAITIAAYSVLANSTSGSAASTGTQALIIGTPAFSLGSTNALQITGSVANYFQAMVQNTSTNKANSSDWVVTADDGSDTTHYADFGINGGQSGAGTASTPFTNAHAAYLYSVDAELDIGALGTSGAVYIYTGGGAATPALAATFSATNLVVVGNISAANLSGTNTGDYTLPTASTVVLGGVKVDGTTITISGGVITAVGGGGGITALTGDVTASGTGSVAATVAKIAGVAVGTPTGTGNVVFSASPTITGTITCAIIAASGIATFSAANSTVSASVITVSTATWSSGGTGTTNFPLFYFNAGTAPTSFSTSGTALGFNAPSGFAGNYIDCHNNGGATVFKVDVSGNITSGSINTGAVTSAAKISTTASGTASAAVFTSTGAVFSGGSTTTNFPLWYISGASATASSTWSATGTAFGINIHTSVGNFFDCKIDGTTKFAISGTGIVNFAGTNTTGAGSALLGTNSPAVTNTAPYTWIQVLTADGSTGYIPVWK